jgi:radical SAM superfamily enzyme YgiQ (UPF0313 family)
MVMLRIVDTGAATMTGRESPSSQTEILLVSCYELGHQPMGLASPMAFLARAGFPVSAIDVSVDPWENLDEDRIRGARLVAISVPMHTALRLGTRVAGRVRALSPGCHICFYGLYASLNADYLLANGADSVLGGEYEQSLVTLAQALAEDVEDTTTPVAAPVLERLAFPVPRRSGLPPLERYAHLDRNGHFGLVGYVEASRGCLHLCRHCPIPPVYKGRFFVVPKEVVLADIRQLVEAGASHITFGDPDFLNGPGHSMAIARALHRLYPQVTFDFTAKVEHLLKHRSLLTELGQLGCIFVVSALESLSDEVLCELDKGHTREDAIEAVHLLRRAGISPRPTWVAFTPWTTLRDYIDVLDWIEEEELVDHVDPVQFTVRLLVPPGSALLGRASIQPYLEALAPESFTHPWTHPDPRMDALHARVSALVEDAVDSKQDPVVTFARIRDLAWSLEGETPSSVPRRPVAADRARAPRLTEAWFC